jgi:hypothetical protein
MPDFRIIDGGGPDKEDRERQQAREWAQSDVERTVCELAANMLRIIRGAGKPYQILLQMKAVIDSAVEFKKVHGYWPDDIIANELHLKSKDEEYWEGQREGRYTKEQVNRLQGAVRIAREKQRFQSLRPALVLASLPASQAFCPWSAATSAPAATFSAVHLVVGGFPHVRPISAHPTHRPEGPRYPGPPRVPQSAKTAPGSIDTVKAIKDDASQMRISSPRKREY